MVEFDWLATSERCNRGGSGGRLRFWPSYQLGALIGRLLAENLASSQRLSKSPELFPIFLDFRPHPAPSCAISCPSRSQLPHGRIPNCSSAAPRPFPPFPPAKLARHLRQRRLRRSFLSPNPGSSSQPTSPRIKNVLLPRHEAIGPLDGPPHGPLRVDQLTSKGR